MRNRLLILYPVLLLLIASVSGQTVNPDAVKITVKPEPVYFEQSASSKYLNFDFLLENTTPGKLKIDSIKVSIFDDKNKFVMRRMIDNHGLSPGILTIPKIELEPKGTLLLFNPFYVFDSSLNLSTLKYEFLFSTETEAAKYKAEIIVKPSIYETKTNLMLPLKGRVFVEAGHDFYAPHRRIDLTSPIAQQVGLKTNSARFAGDLTIGNENGELFKGQGTRPEDWFAYGATVYAPGSGRIVTLVDELPDNKFENGGVTFSDKVSFEKTSGIFGNFIVIDHGNGEFSLFAHLKLGSFKVKLGDVVKQNQPLAEIGFSGNTDFVHTHYQLQNNIDPKIAEGLPAYFNNFNRIWGARITGVKRGQLDSGDVVESK